MTAPRLEPLRPTPRERGLPGVFRDPVRTALLISGVLLFVGSLLDWIEVFQPGHGWTSISSFARAGDGAITLELGLIIGLIAWADRTATSRLPALIALPLVLGIASLLLMKLSFDSAQELLASLANGGGYGYLLPGFYVALAGALLATGLGAAAVLRARRHVSFTFEVRRATLAPILGGAVGAVLGMLAAVVLGENFGTDPTTTGSAVTLLVIVLAIVGGWLGSRVGGAFAG
jgi:hypothetical protein